MGKVLKDTLCFAFDMACVVMFIAVIRYFRWRTGHPMYLATLDVSKAELEGVDPNARPN